MDPSPTENLSKEEQDSVRKYQIEQRALRTRAANGRFRAGNAVFHPDFKDGIVVRQYKKTQLLVEFGTNNGQHIVEERHCVESTSAWERLRCKECGRLFWNPVRRGISPDVCGLDCRNARNRRQRHEREAAEAAKEAEQTARLQAAADAEAVVKAVNTLGEQVTHPESIPSVPEVDPTRNHIALVMRLVGEDRPKRERFTSIEDAIEYLMTLL